MKIAICGVWHVHAEGYAEIAKKHSEVIGVWDADENRKNEFARSFDIKAFESLEELLSSEAEGVIVCSSTDTHAELMVKIADSGKDIFTEKVLALTEEDCGRVADAVKRNNVNFVISFPWKFRDGVVTLKNIVDSGEIGTINFFRFRNCHNGSNANWLPNHFYDAKECGGGAMIDLGAHGMYLADMFCGMPVSVKSVFTRACKNEDANTLNTDGVEDNAVTVMAYENGCIAVNETGFVSAFSSCHLEIGGEKGALIWDGSDRILKRSFLTEGKFTEVKATGGGISPLEAFLLGNAIPGCGIEEAKRLTHLMVEAYKR